ncbi:MAG: hypothetical protein ACXVXP_09720 [Mycobacteriaceae bacterium]
MLRQALGVLLGGATAVRPLGGRSGVRPGTSGLGSATSTTWTVNPHAGALDLEASSAAGPYLYSVDDTSNTGTITAADATNPRIDLVYVTLNDPAEGDGSSTPGAVFGYVAGVAAGSPSAPATPARSMALFTISVPQSGGGSPTTTDVAPFTAAAGAPIPVHSQAERDALTLYDGLSVYRLDLHQVETYSGTAWGIAGHQPAVSVQTTSSVGGITGTATDILTLTVTANGTSRYKVSGFIPYITGVSGDVYAVSLLDNGSVIRWARGTISTAFPFIELWRTLVLTAGTHTIKMQALRTSGSGTETAQATAAEPIELLVEQIA